MIEVRYSERAFNDLQRLTDFLLDSDPTTALDTAGVIFEAIDILARSPEIGRRVHAGNRELVISRGRTGYLALYRYLPNVQRVLVLALRHQREAGYKSL